MFMTWPGWNFPTMRFWWSGKGGNLLVYYPKKNEGIIKGIKFNALVVFAILVFFWGNPVMFFKQTAEMA